MTDPRRLLALVVGAVLAASPVGLLWAWLSPQGVVGITAAGQLVRMGDPKDPRHSAEVFFGADARFLAVCAVAGMVTAAASFLWLRRGPEVPVALAVAGLAGGWVAERVGSLAGEPGFLDLGAQPFLLSWAVAALLTYFILVGTLDREPQPDWVPYHS